MVVIVVAVNSFGLLQVRECLLAHVLIDFPLLLFVA